MTTHTTPADRLAWWREARFGMFIHWGLYAIPAGEWKGKRIKGLGVWLQKQARIPHPEYAELAGQFNPVDFDADFIAKLAHDAGMRYLVFTAKHHDGFAMYHSRVDPFNITEASPFGRDPTAELAAACHRHGLTFCLYYSQDLDWAHPDGGGNDWDYAPESKSFETYFRDKCLPQVEELLTRYGPIGLMWFDMATNITREQSIRLRDLVHQLQPDCLVSGRVGHGVGDYGSLGDNQLPLGTPEGDWETPATLNDSWGFKHYDHNWRAPDAIVGAIVDTAEKGVNYLLNIGPDDAGAVPPPSVDILRRTADWMIVHGEAIHGTAANPWNCEFSWGRVTVKGTRLYLFFRDWPGSAFELRGLTTEVASAAVLGGTAIGCQQRMVGDTPVLSLTLPGTAPAKPISVVRLTCAGPPAVIAGCCQQSDGTLTLPPQLATPHLHSAPISREAVGLGGALAAAEAAEAQNEVRAGPRMGVGPSGVVENWYSEDDYLTWTCHILQPGTHEVSLQTMARKYQPWEGGHDVVVELAGQRIAASVQDHARLHTLRNQHFEEALSRLGTLTIDAVGTYELTLRASHINPTIDHGLCVSRLALWSLAPTSERP